MTIIEASNNIEEFKPRPADPNTSDPTRPHRTTLIRADGIGSTVIDADLACIRAAGVELEWEEVALDSSTIAASGAPDICLRLLAERWTDKPIEPGISTAITISDDDLARLVGVSAATIRMRPTTVSK